MRSRQYPGRFNRKQNPMEEAKNENSLDGGAALALSAGLLLTAATSSEALRVTNVAEEVNCTGAWTHYNQTRELSGRSDSSLYVAKAAWKDGWFGDDFDMGFKIRTYKKNGAAAGEKEGSVLSAGRTAYFHTRNYLPTTNFKLSAKMSSARGTCHNDWRGTLKY